METHLGISALVTKASICGGKIVATGTALIVDPKLVNHVVRTKDITLETLVRSDELRRCPDIRISLLWISQKFPVLQWEILTI